MNEETRPDMTINGSGEVGGGQYRDITINGSGVINGEVNCRRLTINGSGRVNGLVTGGAVTIHGAGKLDRLQQVDALHIHGAGTIQDDSSVKELQVDGTASFQHSITAEGVEIHGALTVHGDCTAEHFTARGGFAIDGLLNADTIEIILHGDCRAREIGGSTIRAALPKHVAGLDKLLHALTNHRHTLTADTIEGDDIQLEQTTAKVVRGKRIVLGAGCNIDLVEYSESFEASKEAQVQAQTKVGG